ncbi:MAG: excinuclease ABC subunit UvrC [Hyphomicrobiaceae bacterium]|nr:excinuclease ABC subunit UvrC [Hyphomicrobiaceae bacterium]
MKPEHPSDAMPAADAAAEAAAPEPARGPAVIQRYLKSLPGSPGVYRMLDAAGTVIYVGKARSLKARVTSYARGTGHTNRIARMISATASMEFVTVRTEAEALLLEANLIKRFRPRYNVLLRDDKSFPYILIARDQAVPQILKHRGARNRKGDYFGPFASAGAVNRTINMLERAFLLRSCSDSMFESRTRPCLLFQIKRCSGPCTGEIDVASYNGLVDEAVRFLRGESQNVRQMYQSLMQEAAERLDYEQAAKYRNRLWALAHVTSDQAINPENIEEADVFAAHQDAGQTCIQVFFFRTGQNWGNRAYYPRADRSLPAEDVLDSFIAQFYDDKPVPRLVLVSHELPNRELLAEALSTKAERRIEIRTPQRGAKLGIVEHALQNAREALARRLAESSSQRLLLEALKTRFELPRRPCRIEVYDNSHIQGAHAVGAMIVAGPDGFVKSQYRKFNIRTSELTPGDDYAMMREVLTRRFKRLKKEMEAGSSEVAPEAAEEDAPEAGAAEARGSRIAPPQPLPIDRRGGSALAFGVLRADESIDEAPTEEEPVLVEGESRQDAESEAEEAQDAPEPEDFPNRPDLVLIDGGAGQLAIARAVLGELGITDIPLIGVAKGPDRDAGREHFHLPDRARPVMLEPRDPVLYFVQRLRDEAHRFVIGAHRAKRSKAVGVNPLDEIPGIGPTRKRALLKHFGSAKAVSRASPEDLQAVAGISAQTARAIYDFFHERTD